MTSVPPLQNLALELWSGWHVWVADHDPLPEKDREPWDWHDRRIPLASFRTEPAARRYAALMGWPV